MEELLHAQPIQESSKYLEFYQQTCSQELTKINEIQLFQIQLQKSNLIDQKIRSYVEQNSNKRKRKQSEIIKKTIRKYPKQQLQENQQLSFEEDNIQNTSDNIQIVLNQTTISQAIRALPIQQQVQILNQEIEKLDNINNITNNQKYYYKHQYQQQLFAKLKDQGEAKSIPHVRQNIEASNHELMLYVLKEQLLRDQNTELLRTSKQYSFGFNSIAGVFGQDQYYLKVRNTNLDFDKIVNDKQLFQQHLLEFKQKLSSSLHISIDQVEILGVSKGSFEIYFKIQGNDKDVIQQHIQNTPNAQKFLHEYCNGKIEYLQYFDQCSQQQKGCTLSSNDFNPQYNKSWDWYNEKVVRGPPYHKYDYYFPRGCYGFGLNVNRYGNQDWLQKDGNPNEWRVMYHGTKQQFVNQIVKCNLKPGTSQFYANGQCLDEFGNKVIVGEGIYFCDKVINTTTNGYGQYTEIGNKQFAVIFMSRVYPKKIRQSEQMQQVGYFVVNNSEHIRPYRILLHEKI